MARTKKSKAIKQVASKKKTIKKSSKKSPKKSSPKKSKTPSTKKASNSVDDILKKFDNRRSALNVHLSALEKKISDLEMKTKMYQEQLVKLDQDREETLDSIAKLGDRRDVEVSQMLEKLGVKVKEVSPESSQGVSPAPAATVVFDVKPAEETESDDGPDQPEDHNSNEDH